MNARSLLTFASAVGLLGLVACQNDVSRAGPATVAPAAETSVAAAPAERTNGFDKMPEPGTKAVCPVMGDSFEVKADSPSSVYQGKTYVFCCPACKPKFEAEPEKYVKS